MSEVRRLEEMVAEAAKRGAVILYPKPDELFIDIDSVEALAAFHQLRPIFEQWRKIEGVKITPSETAGHFHIIVKLREPVPNDETRIYWQALLGSDLKRENLALRHLAAGHPPTVFFEERK